MTAKPNQGHDAQYDIENAPPAQNGDVLAQNAPVPIVEIFDFVDGFV
jgi:hypothetical protein